MTVTWQDKAACRDLEPDIFFPEQGASQARAKAICADCPVRAACLEHALTNGETHGIWGGFSERERQRLGYRAQPPTPIVHGTSAGYIKHRRRFEQPCDDCTEAKRTYTAGWRERALA